VQAALTEVSGPFQLNKKTLRAMSDAKVAPSVIDLMVALTYPQKLVVNRAGPSYSGGDSAIAMGYGLYDPFMSPIIAASALYADCYSMYGFSYPYCGSYYGYRPYGYYGYGYGYGGYYPGYPYYGGGGWVVVDPSPGPPAVPQPEGRAIKGFGYTQIRPREPEPAPRIGNTGGNGGNSTSGTSGTNSNSGGSNSGSSGATSGGYSGGSSTSGSDGARIAVPRPPGGY